MEMESICSNCVNRLHCIIDSSANVQRCAMYVKQPDLSQIIESIADILADKIIERLKK